MSVKFEKTWNMAYDRKLTFCGVLIKYFNEIADKNRWNENTRKQYVRDYERHILPRLGARPLEEYDADDFKKVIADINSTGKIYQDTTLQHYYRLITHVIHAAVDHEGMRDPLWGEKSKMIRTPKDVRNRESLAIPRSMPPIVQSRLATALWSKARESGNMRGLLICFDTGARNKESTGVSVEDHHFPFSDMNCSAIVLHNSTDGQGSERHGKLKTSNAYRISILGPEATEIFRAEVAKIQNMIASGEIVLEENSSIPSVEQVPLVNTDNNHLLPCSSPMLTKAFKALLQDIGYLEDDYYAAVEIVASEEFQKAVKELTPADLGFTDEKEWSAYICRHQHYTNMYIVGFEEIEREYGMGHKFTDPTADRRDFRNPDKFRHYAEKVLRIPTINKAALDPRVIEMNGNDLHYEDAIDDLIKIPLKRGKFEIRITSNEAMTPPEVRIKKMAGVDLKLNYAQKNSHTKYKNTVNVLNPYYREFRNAFAVVEQEKTQKTERPLHEAR